MQLIQLLIISSLSFANEPLAPVVNNIKQVFPENKKVLEGCINMRPSANTSLGCVDSFKYASEVCSVMREPDFKKKYSHIPRKYFYDACGLYAKSENYLADFFALDAKACVNGFETVSDRIVTLHKNKSLLEDHFVFMYEKTSCKDFRTYVNLCTYVDGHLKSTLPKNNQHLPKIDYNLDVNSVCKNKKSGNDALHMLNSDIKFLATGPGEKVYEKLILDYRSRTPANQKKPLNPACEEVRTAYSNLGCERYEEFKDGEAIFFTSEEMREKRIEENKEVRRINLRFEKVTGGSN